MPVRHLNDYLTRMLSPSHMPVVSNSKIYLRSYNSPYFTVCLELHLHNFEKTTSERQIIFYILFPFFLGITTI